MADFTGGPGLLAFLATFAMVVGAILLFRSLGRHLRKVRTRPPEQADAGTGAARAGTSSRTAEAGSDQDGDAANGGTTNGAVEDGATPRD